jgi:hypothetical protein
METTVPLHKIVSNIVRIGPDTNVKKGDNISQRLKLVSDAVKSYRISHFAHFPQGLLNCLSEKKWICFGDCSDLQGNVRECLRGYFPDDQWQPTKVKYNLRILFNKTDVLLLYCGPNLKVNHYENHPKDGRVTVDFFNSTLNLHVHIKVAIAKSSLKGIVEVCIVIFAGVSKIVVVSSCYFNQSQIQFAVKLL